MGMQRSFPGLTASVLLVSLTAINAGPVYGSEETPGPSVYSMSYRATGGLANVEMGLDVQDNGAVAAYQVLFGRRTENWGMLTPLQLADIQAATDDLFRFRGKDFSKPPADGLEHLVVCQVRGTTQIYLSDNPTGKGLACVTLLQATLLDVLNGPPPVLPRNDRKTIDFPDLIIDYGPGNGVGSNYNPIDFPELIIDHGLGNGRGNTGNGAAVRN